MEEARRLGLLGPGPVEAHIDHGRSFAAAARSVGFAGDGRPALDLGSGAGIPGLVLAFEDPDRHWTLLDGRQRSVRFLEEAVAELDLDERVSVVLGRAEEVGRDLEHRGRYALVVARGFGPPAVTAECAAPLLDQDGWLIVSEPPGSSGSRWPGQALDRLGLCWSRNVTSPLATFALLQQVRPAPDDFPRRTGIPAKRPLFQTRSG